MTSGWLISRESYEPFGPYHITLPAVRRLPKFGRVWLVSVTPEFQTPEQLSRDQLTGSLLLAPRFKGNDLEQPAERPVHVHIFVALSPELLHQEVINETQVYHFSWGEVFRDREAAEAALTHDYPRA